MDLLCKHAGRPIIALSNSSLFHSCCHYLKPAQDIRDSLRIAARKVNRRAKRAERAGARSQAIRKGSFKAIKSN